MAKVIFQDERGQNLNRYKMMPVNGQANTYDLERMATITQQGTPYNKEVGDHFLQVEDGTPVQILGCTKSGTVYSLTGLTVTSGAVVCIFQAPSTYDAGETFAAEDDYHGWQQYNIVTTNGEALKYKAFTGGATVIVALDIDNRTITFKGDPAIPTALKNPYAVTFSTGNGGDTGAYDGSAAKTVSIPKITLSTVAPTGTLAIGELYGVY